MPLAPPPSASLTAGFSNGFKEDLEPMEEQPAFAATLRMLEWGRVCEQLSEHASTRAGKQACLALGLPATEEGSQQLLRETRWAVQCRGVVCALCA